jgi:hypothetical protein
MKLKESLEKKKFVVTSEVQAPMGDDDPEALVENLKRIRGRMNGVSIAEVEIEGVVGDSIQTCELLNQNRFDAIYQTTTRDKNRIQLQKDCHRPTNPVWKTCWCSPKIIASPATACRKPCSFMWIRANWRRYSNI